MESVAFLYEFNENDAWSTPWSLMQAFKYGALIPTHRYQLSEAGIEELLKAPLPYDCVITLDWKGLQFEKLQKKYFPDTFLVLECADLPQNWEKHKPNFHKYDLLLSPDYSCTERLKEMGHNAIWWPHFCDQFIHKPYPHTPGTAPVRSTRGPGGSQFLDELSRIMPDKFLNKNGMLGEEYGRFLGEGLITVQSSRFKEVTRRIFEGMACHTCVLTDRLPGYTRINNLFQEDKHIVYYDNMQDCISKINWLLSPEGSIKREEIAEAGYQEVKRNHTAFNRADAIFKEYYKWKK